MLVNKKGVNGERIERDLVDAPRFVVDSWPDLVRGRRQVGAPLVGHTASYWLAVWGYY